MEVSMQSDRTIANGSTFDVVIPLLAMDSKEIKYTVKENDLKPCMCRGSIHNNKNMKTSQIRRRRMNKETATSTLWNFIQPYERMKSYGLQQNSSYWRPSCFVKYARSERTRSTCSVWFKAVFRLITKQIDVSDQLYTYTLTNEWWKWD